MLYDCLSNRPSKKGARFPAVDLSLDLAQSRRFTSNLNFTNFPLCSSGAICHLDALEGKELALPLPGYPIAGEHPAPALRLENRVRGDSIFKAVNSTTEPFVATNKQHGVRAAKAREDIRSPPTWVLHTLETSM